MPAKRARQLLPKKQAKSRQFVLAEPLGDGSYGRADCQDLVVRPDDCVMLRNPDDAGLPFVARVRRIYSPTAPAGKKAEPIIDVQWFYRPHDTPLPQGKHDPAELFESTMMDTNPLEAIDDTCQVLSWDRRKDDTESDFPSPAQRDVFYCRRSFQPRNNKFGPAKLFGSQPSDHSDGSDFDEASGESSDARPESGDDDDDDGEGRRVSGNVKKGTSARRKQAQVSKAASSKAPAKRRAKVQLSISSTHSARAKPTGADLARSRLHVGAVPDSLPCREVCAASYTFHSRFMSCRENFLKYAHLLKSEYAMVGAGACLSAVCQARVKLRPSAPWLHILQRKKRVEPSRHFTTLRSTGWR